MNSIFHRISVRKYEDRPVETEKIMEILRAGMQAPSACNQQPWEFFVVTDKENPEIIQSNSIHRMCSRGTCSYCSCISYRRTCCTIFCANWYGDCTAEYLAGNRCAGPRRSMVWYRTDGGSNGRSPQPSGASGKCEGIFYVCTGLSGRDKTSAEPICA